MLAILDLRIVMARHIDLAPDDRLDLEMSGSLVHVLACELEELLDSVHIAVVRDGQGRHTHLLSPVEQGRDRRETVKNRVLRVDVKVYKSHGDKSNFHISANRSGTKRPAPEPKRIATIQRYRKTLSPQSRPLRKVFNIWKKSRFQPHKTQNYSRK